MIIALIFVICVTPFCLNFETGAGACFLRGKKARNRGSSLRLVGEGISGGKKENDCNSNKITSSGGEDVIFVCNFMAVNGLPYTFSH